MRFTLLIPALFWPRESAEAVLRALALPALETLLARARVERFAPIDTEGWLCQAFEVERQHDWPVAPLTLALDGGEPGSTYCLRADPVHIEVERHRLALIDSALFDIDADDAHTLAAALTAHFEQDGIAFEAPVPGRWYAKVARVPDLVTRPLREVAGGDVQPCLPAGGDALAWHRIFNEAQMLLHAHPVNAAREERGEPTVNSVWFWGGGAAPDVPGTPFDRVWSDDAAAAALGAAADALTAPLPAGAEACLAGGGSAHLAVLDTLESASAYRDADAWRARLATLENAWFAPLAAALRARRLEALALVVPGAQTCYRFDVARADLRRFWRRPRALATYP